MIIDAHSHGIYGKYLDSVLNMGGDWAKRNIDFTLKIPAYTDVIERVKILDKYDIDYQVVTPGGHRFDPNLCP